MYKKKKELLLTKSSFFFIALLYFLDVKEPFQLTGQYDYIIFAAGNADPKNIVNNPLDIIHTNYLGLHNTIEFAFEKSKTIQEVEKRFTHYLNLIQPFLRERKHQIEGRGIHPYWKENDNSPVKIDRYKMLVQFLKLAENENQEKYHRYPDYGTFICGNQVQLDVSKSNYLKIINAMNKVISKDKVVAVIGPMLSGEMMAAGPVANKSKIVALGTSTTAEGITDIGDYIFRNAVPESLAVDTAIKEAHKTLGFKTAAIMYSNNNDQMVSVNNTARKALESVGVQIVDTETFADKDTDFSAQLTKIQQAKPDVIVDFTNPAVIYENAKKMLSAGIHVVIGTTGLTTEQRDELDAIGRANNANCLVAPNFSLGAVMMMKVSAELAPYFPNVEIIELHHNHKYDAPSGTAILTAKLINDAKQAAKVTADEDLTRESLPGARGAKVDDVTIHSVRLPGYVAHQEVLFGGYDETLTIRHDSLSRLSFMPGVVLACKKISSKTGLTYGLEHYL